LCNLTGREEEKRTEVKEQEGKLVQVSEVQRQVDKVKTLEEGVELHDKLATVVKYLIKNKAKIGLKTIEVNQALGEVLRLERKTGEMLPPPVSGKGGDRRSDRFKGNSYLCFSNACKSAGLAKATAKNWWLLSQVPQDEFDIYLEKCNEAERHATQAGLLKIAKTLQRHDRLARRKRSLIGDTFRLLVGDFREQSLSIEDASIDAIITDPPYGSKYLDLYAALVAVAERVLVEGGHCVVMTGQANLPEIYSKLCSASLTYQWTLAYFTPGQSCQVFGRKVKSNWKPLIWLVKGKNTWEHIDDLIRNEKSDRRFHEWGQSVNGMAQIVERFTAEGSIVLDPFVGAGATALAAVALKRFFIGIDKEKSCVDTTAERLTKISKKSTAS
jgi:DNA modification methylase